MVSCPRCKHSNFDGFASCSRCGAPLGGAAAGAGAAGSAGGGMDEYQKMMADRAAKQKRNRTIGIVVAVVVLGGGGFWMIQQRKKTAAAQAVLEAGGRFAEKDKAEMGAFWSCIMSSEVDIGNFQNADQIQQRIESAYFTQQKTYSEHLTTECVPKIERAKGELSSIANDMPPDLKDALDKYLATIPKLQSGIEAYAEKVKGRGAVKDIDQTIEEVVGALSTDPTPESIAAAKFLECAIPDINKKKDMQEILVFLAETCKKDAVPFMTKARETCGSIVQNIDKDAKVKPPKTFKAFAKKFADEENRQAPAFAYCAKHSRKGKKVLDLEEFLTAASDHIEARSNVAMAARDAVGKITGKPLETAKKKGPPGAAEEAPSAPAAPEK